MTLGKLRYWIILVAVIAVAYFISERNTIFDYALGNTKVCEGQLRRFSKTFQQEYRNIIERGIDPQYRKDFEFYSQSPYKTEIVKSNSKGAALVFVPSTNSEYLYRSTDLEIEAAIFPSRTLSEDKRSIKMLESVLECVSYQPCFVVSSQNISFVSLEFLAFGSEWIKVVGEGAVRTKNIVVNKVYYPNLIIMKASTLRRFWSVNKGKQEAQAIFRNEFSSLFEASEDFKEYVAYPELKEIAICIIENLRKNPDYTMFDFDKDFKRLVLTAKQKYGIRGAFAETVYSHLKERGVLKKKLLGIEYTNNWHYSSLSAFFLVFVSLLLTLLNWFLKCSRGTKLNLFLVELKRPLDTFSPFVFCWFLFQQKPVNASLFQALIPWATALFCVCIITYLRMRLNASIKES